MYDIEKVICRRVKRSKPEYLVKWEGYEAPSWVALDDMDYRTGRGLDGKRKKNIGWEKYDIFAVFLGLLGGRFVLYTM